MTGPSWAEVCRRVTARAGSRCEYCRMHQALQGATFHIEHIRPASAGGSDDPENLCLACPSCNLHKSNRLTVPGLEGPADQPVFSPRTERWADHFGWNGFLILGRTGVGRAVIAAFDLNAPRRVRIREAEALFGLFPPPDENESRGSEPPA